MSGLHQIIPGMTAFRPLVGRDRVHGPQVSTLTNVSQTTQVAALPALSTVISSAERMPTAQREVVFAHANNAFRNNFWAKQAIENETSYGQAQAI